MSRQEVKFQGEEKKLSEEKSTILEENVSFKNKILGGRKIIEERKMGIKFKKGKNGAKQERKVKGKEIVSELIEIKIILVKENAQREEKLIREDIVNSK